MNSKPFYFHLSPQKGFMNDPCGLFFKGGIYHIYYQYAKDYPKNTLKSWGHFATKNFTDFIELPPLLSPDCKYDKNGAYTGSALVYDGKINFYYTGNVRSGKSRRQYVIKTTSYNGIDALEKTKIAGPQNYPKIFGENVRDPYVFLYKGNYYFILGGGLKQGGATALVYKNKSGNKWVLSGLADTDFTSYMWECLNYIEGFIIFCKQQENNSGNVSTQYYAKVLNEINSKSVKLGKETLLDYGFDFYAAQCFFDGARYILYGWLGNPTAEYVYKQQNQSMGVLSIPRQVNFTKKGITQKPLPELKKLRCSLIKQEVKSGDSFNNNTDCFEACFIPKSKNFKLVIKGAKILKQENTLHISVNSGKRKTKIMPYYSGNVRIFCDTSSIELFSGGKTFSSRIYSDNNNILIEDGIGILKIYKLKPVTILRKEQNYEKL